MKSNTHCISLSSVSVLVGSGKYYRIPIQTHNEHSRPLSIQTHAHAYMYCMTKIEQDTVHEIVEFEISLSNLSCWHTYTHTLTWTRAPSPHSITTEPRHSRKCVETQTTTLDTYNQQCISLSIHLLRLVSMCVSVFGFLLWKRRREHKYYKQLQ